MKFYEVCGTMKVYMLCLKKFKMFNAATLQTFHLTIIKKTIIFGNVRWFLLIITYVIIIITYNKCKIYTVGQTN